MGRDITKLHPEAQEKAKQLVSLCAANGLKIKITECYRTVAEQDTLYAQGRTKPGKIVTNAKGSSYSSMHQWGVAFDFIRSDGRKSYDDSDGFFTKVGRLGQSIGLTWGIAWNDKPHFQLSQWGDTPSKLKNLYSKPEKFFATWNKVENITAQIGYSAHIATIGDQEIKYNGQTAGTTGRSLAVQALRVFSGDVEFKASGHVQDIGWQSEVSGHDITIGTKGQSKRLEAFKIELVNSNKILKVRTHIQGIGWTNWAAAKGNVFGTTGKGLRIEAIEMKIV